MDVILDSNVYVSDYRMETIPFKNLFDYLKRTGDSLVLLRIVREEVVAQFARDLKKRGKEVAEAWKAYRSLHFPEKLAEFAKPDIKGQAKELRKRLMKPTGPAKVTYLDDTSNISVDEVYMRGIKRTPPANGDGEELRDVIVWLSALDYAKTSKRQIAFVSADSGFWAKDAVRPEIQEDITRFGVALHMYKDIDKFVEENSPEAKPVEEKWAYDVFPEFHDDLIASVENAIQSSRRGLGGGVSAIKLKSAGFKEGKMYEVAPEVQVAELLFTVNIEFESRTVTNSVPLSSLAGPIGIRANALVSPAQGYGLGETFSPLGSGIYGVPVSPGPFGWLEASGFYGRAQPRVLENRYTLNGTARLSARILQGRVSEKEVTELKIEKIDQIEDGTGVSSP